MWDSFESNLVQVKKFHRRSEPCRLGYEARQSRNQRRIFHCLIAKRERIQMRFRGLKARNVKARGEAQRSPGKRPSIRPRPVRPEHRCVTCAGLSGLGFSAPPARALQAGLSHRGPSALMPDPFSESVGHRPIPPAERGRGRCSATALPPRLAPALRSVSPAFAAGLDSSRAVSPLCFATALQNFIPHFYKRLNTF